MESALRKLFVAASEQGVCAVKIGDHYESLEEELRAELSRRNSAPGSSALAGWVSAIIVEHLSEQLPNLYLPVDVRATAFQGLVWEYLRNIP